MRSRSLLLIIACFFCAYSFAQQHPFVHYTPKDGLINSRVRLIKQDSKGRMYFLTYAGLSVYDGTRFMNYTKQDGLDDDLINDIVEITPDSFLVATNTLSLNTLVRGKIGHYKTADGFTPLVNRFLKSADGNWYCTSDDGLYLFKDRRFTKLPFNDSKGEYLGNTLNWIVEWKKYLLIIPWGTARLFFYDKEKRTVTYIYNEYGVSGCDIDKKGRIWISTANGIFTVNNQSMEKGIVQLETLPEPYQNISSWKHRLVHFDDFGNCWVFGREGMTKILPDGKHQMISSRLGLKTGAMVDIFIDREGIAWGAFDGNGVMKMSGINIQLMNDFIENKVATLYALNSDGKDAWIYDASSHSISRYNDSGNKTYRLGGKRSIYVNIHPFGKTLYLQDLYSIMLISDKNDPNAYQHPKEILSPGKKGILLGNNVMDANGAIIQVLRKPDASFWIVAIHNERIVMEHPIPYQVDQITIDRKGRLWLATRSNELLVFSLNPKQPEKYLQLIRKFKDELPQIGPRSITTDHNLNVWIGGRYSGLFCLKFNDGLDLLDTKQFTVRNGLTDNFIYHLACDNNNNIWAGTQTGVDKIFFKNDRYIISNVTKSHNMFHSVFKLAASADNTIWALTNDQNLLKITDAEESKIATPPPLLITSIIVNDEERADSITNFSYKENNFYFNVAAPSFIDEASIQYSYLLEGSGKHTWSEPSNNGSFNFINLLPGDYVLHLKADFPSAIYPPQTAAYRFSIAPPWWQTWWFRGLLAVSLTSIFLIVIRSYYHRKLARQKIELERKQAIENERTRIATDMHDDLGAGLSRIKFLSETIGMKKQQQQPIEEEITGIRQYSHEMIDKMGEIVWALNEKNDSLSDLLAYTRSYAVEYLTFSGINCSIIMPEQFPSNFVSGEYRRNIFLTVKEALHNIVKHSMANSVRVEFDVKDKLVIQISDDGVGFDKNNTRPFSNGLENMEKRISNIGGKLKIRNEGGTIVTIMAPISH